MCKDIEIRRINRALIALVLGCLPLPALAKDIQVDAPISDDAYDRLVACAAEPARRSCRKPKLFIGQSRRPKVTVAIKHVERGFPSKQEQAMRSALAAAIKVINAVGSGLTL